jgi:putative transcriptional regulator
VKNRLEEIRKARNMLQEELADALKVSRQTISSLENGRYNPSIVLAFKIARLFNMRIEDIFIYEDEKDRAASEVEQKKRDLHKKWKSKN